MGVVENLGLCPQPGRHGIAWHGRAAEAERAIERKDPFGTKLLGQRTELNEAVPR